MAIQYYMRGWTGSAYVDWVVNDQPDNTGVYAPVGSLTNIVVNRIVQSKVDNFLKNTEGLNSPTSGPDAFWLHVNAYDWINPLTPPGPALPVPTQISGLAVVRGSANGGTTPRDYSSFFWDEVNQTWKLAFNTAGDGTTVGALQNLALGAMSMNGPLTIGSPASLTGLIRLPSNESDATGNTGAIKARNAGNTGDVFLILADGSSRVQLGSSTDPVYVPSTLRVDTGITQSHDSTSGLVAQSGFIRAANHTTIIAARANPGVVDLQILATDLSNNIIIGDLNSNTTEFNNSTGTYLFGNSSGFNFFIAPNSAYFGALVSSPTITQNSTGTGNGQLLTISAQNSSAGSSTGGSLALTSGTGTTVAGNVSIETGSNLQVVVSPTSVTQYSNLFTFNGAASNPIINQTAINVASGTGQTLTLAAQNNTGTTSTGGALVLSSGSGTITNGNIFVQTGGTNLMVISPTNFAPLSYPTTTGKVVITGNLEVQGTTTTVDSTVVDIIGRVIHGNWADPSVSPNVAVPSQIAGYSIHRGNIAGVPRDGAAWLWTEGTQVSGSDGYWRAVTNPGDGYGTDGYTISNVTNIFGVMASNFSASNDPNAAPGYLSSVGGHRNPNNTTAISARNLTSSTLITGASIGASLPQSTINVSSTTAFTSSGTLLVQSSIGNQIVTYTGTSGGNQFTGCSGGTGTLSATSMVGQTTQSTTIASGSNNATLPTGTINVASTVGFPASGTIRIYAGIGGVQNIAYTGTSGGTQFTGCTGGTGTLSTGNVVSSPPPVGNADLLLLGSDYGNHLVLGDSTNSGQVFNVSTGSVYNFEVNGLSALVVTPVSAGTTQITYASTVTAAQINQAATTAASGAPMTIQSQVTTANSGTGGTLSVIAGNASGTTSTGGALNLASGSGTTINGVINFQPGGTTELVLSATGASLQWVNTVTSPTLSQANNTTNSATGQNLTIQAQNATGTTTTGGNAIITSGTGTTVAGNVNLQTGAVTRVSVNPTFTTFNDTSEAYRVTPLSAGATTLQAINTATSVTYRQGDLTTASGTGAATTIQAQNETGTTSIGGALNLTSGTGTTTNGAVNLQVGGVTTASVVTNKFVHNKGQRRNVTAITTTYLVLASDDYISITTIAAPFTVTLPATPTTGDTYTVKDAGGNAATNNVTISGNGANIDGTSTITLSQNYSSVVLTYTGTQWSVS